MFGIYSVTPDAISRVDLGVEALILGRYAGIANAYAACGRASVNAHAIWRNFNQDICQLPDPITRQSRAACTMSALTSSTRLRVMIRRICANRRSISRKLPRVIRITAA